MPFGAIGKALGGGLGAALGGGALGLAHKAVGKKLGGTAGAIMGGAAAAAGRMPRPKFGAGPVKGAVKGALFGKGGGKTQKPMPKRPKK